MCVKALSPEGGLDASKAIMTTDTVPKSVAAALEVGGATIRLGGMTKGAGMIAPKLKLQPPQATMLCYVTTDACIERDALNACLAKAIGMSFNRITVDGDTSTNTRPCACEWRAATSAFDWGRLNAIYLED